VVGVGELCLDASAFAEATADKRCWILDARKMARGLNIIGRYGAVNGGFVRSLEKVKG
jgi:hypothetical protein